MTHLQRNLISVALVAVALVAGAYALLGAGFAVIVAIGLLMVGGFLFAGLVVFEEETHLPAWHEADEADAQHGYHPARRDRSSVGEVP